MDFWNWDMQQFILKRATNIEFYVTINLFYSTGVDLFSYPSTRKKKIFLVQTWIIDQWNYIMRRHT